MLWNKCWAGLLVGASIFSSVLASPIPAAPRDAPLSKREYVPDDATDYNKVLEWMDDEGIQNERLVFYTGGKQADALAFVENNPLYAYFWDVFDEDFQKDFGGVAMDSEVTAACSKAFALNAEGDVRVFGDALGGDDGYWASIEKPILLADSSIDHIWSMDDGTTDKDAHAAGDLKG
ncbi:hypothetical protein K491DRAFT_679616 [Lophiostoma macrostomum CBS 122681]|uniref:Uncharacterized protein n=1 Tax=Lophiostoma macrostomum CBS 122681 TaxID=1314788 RepID=A0A6A6T6N2_9PLEO|nr:hypothetical protein K491DRAFT_679616 [Lophiostoma macrostomum CBS 122681]